MKQVYIFLSILFLAVFTQNTVSAQQQSFKRNRYYSIGACLNAMNYVGDLDPGPTILSPSIKFTRYNFGITTLYRYSPRVSFRGTFSYGRIKGSDAESSNYDIKNVNRLYRNLSFRNQIYELKADIVIDLFENRGKYTKRPDYTPYIFAGLAYFHHNPQAQDPNGNWVDLRPLHTEGQGLPGGPKQYSLNQIALPIGAGFRYKLTKQLDLAFEIGWRFTLTDYLDDVGGKYADKQQLTDNYGDLSRVMSDRSYEAYSTNPEVQASADNHYGSVGGDASVEGYDPGHNIGSTDPWLAINSYGTAGVQRGDTKGRRDVYIITGFHLTYILPEKVVCPKFRN
ncbi:MAG: outer membrane beta-barrel protein [Cytophagales bacterium]|nr:outer membrane beta-barrel protein [Cytophaga sp.]